MKEVLKEAYEVPRITVRGLVLENGIALPVSMEIESITQEDWSDSAEETVGGGLADREGNIGLIY
jgi:hypothetical protein